MRALLLSLLVASHATFAAGAEFDTGAPPLLFAIALMDGERLENSAVVSGRDGGTASTSFMAERPASARVAREKAAAPVTASGNEGLSFSVNLQPQLQPDGRILVDLRISCGRFLTIPEAFDGVQLSQSTSIDVTRQVTLEGGREATVPLGIFFVDQGWRGDWTLKLSRLPSPGGR